MKTNNAYAKRLRVTRKGKIIARKPGKNHFNAKESRNAQLAGKRTAEFQMTNKQIARFLPR